MSQPKTQDRKVGENALEKAVRLLNKLNDDLLPEGSGRSITMTLEAGGCGILTDGDRPMFGFDDLQHLLDFLEAGQLRRLFMVAKWAER